jgi:hypothetical protein
VFGNDNLGGALNLSAGRATPQVFAPSQSTDGESQSSTLVVRRHGAQMERPLVKRTCHGAWARVPLFRLMSQSWLRGRAKAMLSFASPFVSFARLPEGVRLK